MGTHSGGILLNISYEEFREKLFELYATHCDFAMFERSSYAFSKRGKEEKKLAFPSVPSMRSVEYQQAVEAIQAVKDSSELQALSAFTDTISEFRDFQKSSL